MSVPIILYDPQTGEAMHTEGYQSPHGSGRAYIFTTLEKHYGVFKSATYNDETATLASPGEGGSLLLTDLIITSKKKLTSNVTVQFYDGTNTELIVLVSADNPIVFSHTFGGKYQGWKDAYVQVIVSAAFDVTVSVGYVKIPSGGTLEYASWDTER